MKTFVAENREVLGRNISGLNRVSKVLVKQRDALSEILEAGPLALNNLALTYNPQAGTLDTNANLGELVNQIESDPATLLCGFLSQADNSGALCDLVQQTLPRTATLGEGKGAPTSGDRFDPTLGGLVEVDAMRTVLRAFVALLAGTLLLTGCDFDVYELPLPGGTDAGDDAITVTAEFRDVLDLVPKSTVKVNDVSVGQVTDVELDGQHAVVTLELRNDVELPENAIAEIRQTSLLGEKFVSLSAAGGRRARRASSETGDVIPLDRTGRNPEVEEVLGALSLLLNGGGVAQLKTIATELNNALEGREDTTQSVLEQVRLFMSQLDENKEDIVTRDRVAEPPRDLGQRPAWTPSTPRSRSCPAR